MFINGQSLCCRSNPFSGLNPLVILILPSLNMHSDELKKLFLEPILSLEKNTSQVRISFSYSVYMDTN